MLRVAYLMSSVQNPDVFFVSLIECGEGFNSHLKNLLRALKRV